MIEATKGLAAYRCRQDASRDWAR